MSHAGCHRTNYLNSQPLERAASTYMNPPPTELEPGPNAEIPSTWPFASLRQWWDERKEKTPMGHHYRERHQAGDYNPNSELTKAEIQEKLSALGQPTTGNKDELLERLDAAQTGQATTTSDDLVGLQP